MITDPQIALSIAKQIAFMHDAFDQDAQPCLDDLPQANSYYRALQSQLKVEQAAYPELADELERQRTQAPAGER